LTLHTLLGKMFTRRDIKLRKHCALLESLPCMCVGLSCICLELTRSADWQLQLNLPLPPPAPPRPPPHFLHTVQGGSDKSGIFLFYLLNGTTQLKIIRFYCSEKKLQIYILRINLSNKTAVSSEDSLDRGPEAPAGLCQGVPGEEPH
jgi:hypothetical protein